MKSQFEQIYTGIANRKGPFFVTFFIVVIVTYTILYLLDFYPEPKTAPEESDTNGSAFTVASTTAPSEVYYEHESEESAEPAVVEPIMPVRIAIPRTGADVEVLNPKSLDVTDLDTALLDGVARHPQSADLATSGNILIFGHSSYLPTVFNKNFQAFNGVQNLIWGDTIILYDEAGNEYHYRVEDVHTAKASETVIDNTRGKAMLTLVTCNVFASKDDRFVVEANLVSTVAAK